MTELTNTLRNLNDNLFVFFAILSISVLFGVGIIYFINWVVKKLK